MKYSKRDIFGTVILLGMSSVLVYVIVRTLLFLFANYTLVEKVFAFFLMMGEFFVLMHSLGYMFSVLRVHRSEAGPGISIPEGEGERVSVAILVAARHEPKEILEDTFDSLEFAIHTKAHLRG